MTTYTLGGRMFSSKKAVSDHAKQIKDAHRPGDILAGDELQFMYDLLRWHPDAARKIGAGVQIIMIRANPLFGQNEFYLRRVDGSSTEFSYKQCVQPSTPAADFRAACRVAIGKDITAFAREWFARNVYNPRCELTGERLTLDIAHVDHVPPRTFQALVERFVAEHDIDVNTVRIGGRAADNSFRLRIADPDLEDAWIRFHRRYAQLRVISEDANLNIVGHEWGVILDYLRSIDSADTLIEWKGTRRFYTHLDGVQQGLLLNADRAAEGTPLIDGTVAIIEASYIAENTAAL